MSFIRSTTLRASSIARSARSVRTAELQPWQRAVQRRTYASAHGHAHTKKSDLPWMVSSLAGTAAALYVVLNQDLGHSGVEKMHHDEAHKLESQPEEKHGKAKPHPKLPPTDGDDATNVSEEEKKAAKKHKEQSESEKASEKPEESKEEPAEEKDDKSSSATDGDSSSKPAPDERDTPDPRKPASDKTDMSGKQEGLSNDDTKHSTDVHNNPQKSKKGEGVAETAKLKGTVSTDRPQAESEQRGKPKLDKDE